MARSAALIPITGSDGTIIWQQWTYGELVQHLANDLEPDPSNVDLSILRANTFIPFIYVGLWGTTAAGPSAAYFKDALGIVHLRGRITGGASATTPFTIPLAARPHNPGVDLYACGAYTGAAAGFAFLAVDGSNGNVSVFYSAGVTEVGLGGINWLAEA